MTATVSSKDREIMPKINLEKCLPIRGCGIDGPQSHEMLEGLILLGHCPHFPSYELELETTVPELWYCLRAAESTQKCKTAQRGVVEWKSTLYVNIIPWTNTCREGAEMGTLMGYWPLMILIASE